MIKGTSARPCGLREGAQYLSLQSGSTLSYDIRTIDQDAQSAAADLATARSGTRQDSSHCNAVILAGVQQLQDVRQ